LHGGARTSDNRQLKADNYGSGKGGRISLRGDNQINLTNVTRIHAVAQSSGDGAGIAFFTASTGVISIDSSTAMVRSAGTGNAGALTVNTGELDLTNGGLLTSTADALGLGGPVTVSARSMLF